MKVNEEDFNNFRVVYYETLGEEIGQEEAIALGSKLLQLVELVYKPMTWAQMATLLERQRELEDKARIIEI